MKVEKTLIINHENPDIPTSFAQDHDRNFPNRLEFSGFVEFDNTSEYKSQNICPHTHVQERVTKARFNW